MHTHHPIHCNSVALTLGKDKKWFEIEAEETMHIPQSWEAISKRMSLPHTFCGGIAYIVALPVTILGHWI